MTTVADSNNEIIREWDQQFRPKLDDSKSRLGIKHHRNRSNPKTRSKLYQDKGEINRIGVRMNKGLIFTHKGVGKSNANRTAKPWFNPIAEQEVNELANRIAENTGDVVAGHILIQ